MYLLPLHVGFGKVLISESPTFNSPCVIDETEKGNVATQMKHPSYHGAISDPATREICTHGCSMCMSLKLLAATRPESPPTLPTPNRRRAQVHSRSKITSYSNYCYPLSAKPCRILSACAGTDSSGGFFFRMAAVDSFLSHEHGAQSHFRMELCSHHTLIIEIGRLDYVECCCTPGFCSHTLRMQGVKTTPLDVLPPSVGWVLLGSAGSAGASAGGCTLHLG